MAEAVPFRENLTTGFLHVPSNSVDQGLVLTHGAGSNCRAPLLLVVAEAFASAGIHVLRCNLRFRQQRPFGPPSPAHASDDRLGLQEAVTALRRIVSGRIFLGGHSYGGRQASMLAAEHSSVADGLLLLSYPLHPPNAPKKSRTDHFPNLHIPSLFIHGTKDPFGSIDELQQALRLIPAATELVKIEKAGHDLASGKFDTSTAIPDRLRALSSTPSR